MISNPIKLKPQRHQYKIDIEASSINTFHPKITNHHQILKIQRDQYKYKIYSTKQYMTGKN